MTFKNYINIFLIILVMFLIFSFSSQDGDESGSLSDALLIKIYQVVELLFLQKIIILYLIIREMKIILHLVGL